MPYGRNYVKELLSDKRHLDVGLSEGEGKYVINLCNKFTNLRDEIDDLYQIALIAIKLAFESKANKNEEIKSRKSFIRSVVYYAMCAQVIRKNKKDLIYHSLNLFTDIEDYEMRVSRSDSYFTKDE